MASYAAVACVSLLWHVSVALTPLTDGNFTDAADEWVWNPSGAEGIYGPIHQWDVSRVTDMEGTFEDAYGFNGDVSSWDVSRVTDMGGTFFGASEFNGDLSSWDVSRVTDMGGTFEDASGFNGDVSSWDVSRVTTMRWTFSYASEFNGDLSSWDVSRVTDMGGIFDGNRYFCTPPYEFDLPENAVDAGDCTPWTWENNMATMPIFVKSGSSCALTPKLTYECEGRCTDGDISAECSGAYLFHLKTSQLALATIFLPHLFWVL